MKDLAFTRHRRLRSSASMRALVRETHLHKEDLIYPIFIIDGKNIKNEINSMPGVFQLSLDNLEDEMTEVANLGIKSVILFGVPSDMIRMNSWLRCLSRPRYCSGGYSFY